MSVNQNTQIIEEQYIIELFRNEYSADLNESPASFNLTNKLENWNFFSGFHRIFLFELKSRKVFELNISD